MKGFSLIESVVSLFFISTIVLSGYECFQNQQTLFKRLSSISTVEQDLNYRIVLLSKLVENCRELHRIDPFKRKTDYFFPDLFYDPAPQAHAFTIVCASAQSFLFEKQGTHFLIYSSGEIPRGTLLLLTGNTDSGAYDWCYAKVLEDAPQGSVRKVKADIIRGSTALQTGRCSFATLNRLYFANRTLHWVQPEGERQPFLNNIDEFAYTLEDSFLTLRIRSGLVSTQLEFRL